MAAVPIAPEAPVIKTAPGKAVSVVAVRLDVAVPVVADERSPVDDRATGDDPAGAVSSAGNPARVVLEPIAVVRAQLYLLDECLRNLRAHDRHERASDPDRERTVRTAERPSERDLRLRGARHREQNDRDRGNDENQTLLHDYLPRGYAAVIEESRNAGASPLHRKQRTYQESPVPSGRQLVPHPEQLAKFRLKPPRGLMKPVSRQIGDFVSNNAPGVAGIALGGTRRPGRAEEHRAAATVRGHRDRVVWSRAWRVPSDSAAAGQRRRLRAALRLSPAAAPAAGPPPGGGRERRRTPKTANRPAATAPSRQSDGRFSYHGTPSRADKGGGPDAGAGCQEGLTQPRSTLVGEVDSFVKMSLIEEI